MGGRDHAGQLQYGIGADHHAGTEAGAGLEAVRGGGRAAGQHHGRSTVGHLAGIGCRHHALLHAAEHRLHASHAFLVDHGTHAFVVVKLQGVAVLVHAWHCSDFLMQARLARGMGAAVAFDGEGIAIGAAELPALGNQFRTFHLMRNGEALEDARVQVVESGEIVPAQRQVEEHGHTAHAFNAAADGKVQIARSNGLCCRMHRILAGSAHAVQAHARYGFGQAGQQHRLARDVGALLTGLADTAGNHIADLAGRHSGARERLLQDAGQQGIGARLAQGALALAEGRAYGGEDDGIVGVESHGNSLVMLMRALRRRWPCRAPSRAR